MSFDFYLSSPREVYISEFSQLLCQLLCESEFVRL